MTGRTGGVASTSRKLTAGVLAATLFVSGCQTTGMAGQIHQDIALESDKTDRASGAIVDAFSYVDGLDRRTC